MKYVKLPSTRVISYHMVGKSAPTLRGSTGSSLAKVETTGHATTGHATSPTAAPHSSLLLLHEHLEQKIWVDPAHSTHPTTMAVHSTGLGVRIIQVLFFNTFVIPLLLNRIGKHLVC